MRSKEDQEQRHELNRN
jgi:hypothetical protein